MTRKSVWLYVAAFSVVLASVLWATLVMAAPSFQPTARPVAATITVTTTGDTITCGTPCSLRGAILVANSGDTIVIPAGTYTLTSGSELTINTTLTLTGAGSGDTIIQAATSSADATSRIFNITGGDVAISAVTIRHGSTSSNGGGIHNAGTLTATNSTVAGNVASGDGGGIANSGTLTLDNTTVSNNMAGSYGGGISGGILNVTNSTVSGNKASTVGGGIVSSVMLSLTNSTVSNNTASGGAGIWNEVGGTLHVTSSTISSN